MRGDPPAAQRSLARLEDLTEPRTFGRASNFTVERLVPGEANIVRSADEIILVVAGARTVVGGKMVDARSVAILPPGNHVAEPEDGALVYALTTGRDTQGASPEAFSKHPLVAPVGAAFDVLGSDGTPRVHLWRDDEHITAGPRSLLIVPPQIIHTTEGVGDGYHLLIDVFAPPRRDFIAKGWVANTGDYPDKHRNRET